MCYVEEVRPGDDVMTVDEFIKYVNSGFFRDYDGFGHPVRDGKSSAQYIHPSRIDELPKDATHVVWYNR